MRFYCDKKHGVYLNARDLMDSIQQILDDAPDEAVEGKRMLEAVITAIGAQRALVLNEIDK